MKKEAIKKGTNFEKLIGWIQKSVHKSADIKINERIKDADTGRMRQVDITIRLKDGPTEFFGIVEVRDRKCKIGVRYVEEVHSKQRSVKADAVFLVSRSGFTGSACTKAEKLGIRLLTYEEAKDIDWSPWLRCRTFILVQKRYEKPAIQLYDADSGNIIKPSKKFRREFKANKNAKLILNERGESILSLPDLIQKVINTYGERPFEGINTDGSRERRYLLFEGNFTEQIFIKSSDQRSARIGKISIKADFYFESKEYPIKLMRFKGQNNNSSIAEVATTEIEILGKKFNFDILAPWAGDHISEGLVIRSTPIEKEQIS